MLSAPTRPAFSLIVLNYNGAELLRECLDSIAGQSERNFELILVDNGSTVPWRHRIGDALRDRTLVVENGSNLGYAEGNNRGILKARADWIVLINNDAALAPDFTLQAARAVEARPEYRMFAPQVLVRDAPNIIDSAGLGLFLDGTARCRGWQEEAARYQEPAEVLGPAGSVALYHRSVFEEAGPLDEDFFCYLEDGDLMLRARWLGLRALYWPPMRAFHSKSSTMGRATPEKAYLVERNHVFVALKNLPLALVALGPALTALRYAFQAFAALSGQGIAGRFVREYSWAQLPGILWRSYGDALLALPRMLEKRRRIRETRRVPRLEFLRALWRFRLTWRDFALKD